MLRWPTLIQFNREAILTAEELYVKFHVLPLFEITWIHAETTCFSRTGEKQHKKKKPPQCASTRWIDAARYNIHGRLILPTEKLPATIYHSRSYEAARVILAVAEKKRDYRISVRGNYPEWNKKLYALKTSYRGDFLSGTAWRILPTALIISNLEHYRD